MFKLAAAAAKSLQSLSADLLRLTPHSAAKKKKKKGLLRLLRGNQPALVAAAAAKTEMLRIFPLVI